VIYECILIFGTVGKSGVVCTPLCFSNCRIYAVASRQVPAALSRFKTLKS